MSAVQISCTKCACRVVTNTRRSARPATDRRLTLEQAPRNIPFPPTTRLVRFEPRGPPNPLDTTACFGSVYGCTSRKIGSWSVVWECEKSRPNRSTPPIADSNTQRSFRSRRHIEMPRRGRGLPSLWGASFTTSSLEEGSRWRCLAWVIKEPSVALGWCCRRMVRRQRLQGLNLGIFGGRPPKRLGIVVRTGWSHHPRTTGWLPGRTSRLGCPTAGNA